MQFVIGEFALLSFGAWARERAGASQNVLAVIFALVIVLPVIAILGGGGDMIRRGSPSVAPAFVGALGAGLLLVIGTVTGALQAIDTIGEGELIGFRLGSFGPEPGGPGMVMALATFVVAAVAVAGLAGLSRGDAPSDWPRRRCRSSPSPWPCWEGWWAAAVSLSPVSPTPMRRVSRSSAPSPERGFSCSPSEWPWVWSTWWPQWCGVGRTTMTTCRAGPSSTPPTSEIPAVASPYPLYDRDEDGGA